MEGWEGPHGRGGCISFGKSAVVGTRVNIGVDGVGFGNRWLRGASWMGWMYIFRQVP